MTWTVSAVSRCSVRSVKNWNAEWTSAEQQMGLAWNCSNSKSKLSQLLFYFVLTLIVTK